MKERIAYIELHKVYGNLVKSVGVTWKGSIDAPILVDKEILNDNDFIMTPFLLKRIQDYNEHTAMFIRVDWRARIVRFIHRIWWAK